MSLILDMLSIIISVGYTGIWDPIQLILLLVYICAWKYVFLARRDIKKQLQY